MKAWQIHSPGGFSNLHLVDIPDPGSPGPGEIRVAVQANSLNYHDLILANGSFPTADRRIPLSDAAGTVEALGPDVTEFQPGDSVISTFFPTWLSGFPTAEAGSFATTPGDGVEGYAAQYIVRPVTSFTHAPKGWAATASATIPTSALTAWRGLVVEGSLQAGQTVLVQGSGGVSTAALQIAKAMGAQVIATSSSEEKLKRLRKLGATHTINYKTDPEWGKTAFKLTGNRGVDHVVEVGGPATLRQSLHALKVGGHITLIGILSGTEGSLPTMMALFKQARLTAVIVANRSHQQEFVRALETISFDPLIHEIFPATELPQAFQLLESATHIGKIVIEW